MSHPIDKSIHELLSVPREEPVAKPETVKLFCPICGHKINAALIWEKETGEFGTILAEWAEMDPDPDSFDHGSYCTCDFSKPIAEVLADWYNDGDRIYDLLQPAPPDLGEAERALLEMVADAGPEGLPLGQLLAPVINPDQPEMILPPFTPVVGSYVWVQRKVQEVFADGYVRVSKGPGEEHNIDVIPDSPRLPEVARWLARTPSAWLSIQLLVDVRDAARTLRNYSPITEWGQRRLELYDRLEAIDTEHNIAIQELLEALESPKEETE